VHSEPPEVTTTAAAAPPGVYADKRCWKGAKVDIFHNKSLAAKLVGVAIAGDGADAQAAFEDAVDAWKANIAASDKLKDVLKLGYGGATDKYAGDAVGKPKEEQNDRKDEYAFQVKYLANDPHKQLGDGQNTCATGHKDANARPPRDGDGWVWNDDTAIGSTTEIDARLAETKYKQDADKFITEADITWMTHVSTGETKCKLIAWN
jgi:hypothetical protein